MALFGGHGPTSKIFKIIRLYNLIYVNIIYALNNAINITVFEW